MYSFLQRHAHGVAYPTPSLKMGVTNFNAQIRFMVQLYFCLSKFVNFYPTFVRSHASRTRPVFPPKNGLGQQNQIDQKWPQLSNIELLRLQRGLLRYELFCRLLGLPSIALSCNRDLCDAVVIASSISVPSQIWTSNPFSDILPIDEVEEIVCASIYVTDLYDSLRWNAFEEFHNHVLGLYQGQVDSELDKDDNDERKTAEHWVSQSEGQILDFRYSKPYSVSDWTESMTRLGLVFLDRLTRSSIAERRELMRNVFNNFLRPCHPSFLWRYWDDVVYERCTAEGFNLGVGPYCNSMLQASTSSSIPKLIDMDEHHRLRRLGWVFFDDKSKLRSLGLPHHARASTMRRWFKKPENLRLSEFPLEPKMPDSALAARFTEQEWNEQVMEKYSFKDRREDYQAMSQFAAGARAVVDFTSTQLPHID